MRLSAVTAALVVALLPASVLAQRPHQTDGDDDSSSSVDNGYPYGSGGAYDAGTNATICSDCRAGGPSCPKSLTIPAWFSHSFTVTGPDSSFNVWNYLAATEDPTDNLITAIVDPQGGIYTRTYDARHSCQAETNFRTQENKNRLVIKCDNWFFSCKVHLQYAVGTSSTSSGESAGPAGSISAPVNSTGSTNETIASAISAPATSSGNQPSAAVIGLAVGCSLLAAALIGLGAFLFARKRKADKAKKRNAALESATNLSPSDQVTSDRDVVALSSYPGADADSNVPVYPTGNPYAASPSPYAEPAPSYLADDVDYVKMYGYDPRAYGYVGEIPIKAPVGSSGPAPASSSAAGAPAPTRTASMTSPKGF